MLEEVLRYINNRFECRAYEGSFEISEGGLELPDALDGQYFWVDGSVFNDGLHTYPETGMRDEVFTGEVHLLAIPHAVEEIADEAEAWCSENAAAIGSPYQSESFGGYSYTLKDGGSGDETASAAWQAQFGARLRPWRKLSRRWD